MLVLQMTFKNLTNGCAPTSPVYPLIDSVLLIVVNV